MMKTLILAGLALMLITGTAPVHAEMAGTMTVLHPWTRATPPNAETAGAYLTLRNDGQAEDALVSARSPVADKVELHSMTVDEGIMRMRSVGEAGVVVPAGETVALSPGGVHIMMIGLKEPLREGEHVPLTLTFRSGASVTVELTTEAMGSRPPAHDPGGNEEHSH